MKIDYNKVIAANAAHMSGKEPEQDNDLDPEAANEITSTSRILKVQWLSEPVTRDMFEAITKNIEELEERARTLAYNYNNEQKHLEIINLLVRATELRNLKNTYGK